MTEPLQITRRPSPSLATLRRPVSPAAIDLASRLDPAQFARHRLGLDLDPWQSDFVRSRGDTILNCSRQSGKSTMMGVIAVWQMLYRPRTLTLVATPSERQSKAFLKARVLPFLEKVGEPAPRIARQTTTSIEFSNGASVIAVPDNPAALRGLTVDLVLVDEAAFVSDGIYAAVSPMLAVTRGRFVLASTPNGRFGYFFDSWHSEAAGWNKFEVPATMNPRISHEFLERERSRLGPSKFAAEYECAFVERNDAVFRDQDIQALTSFEDEDKEIWQ